MGNLTVFNVRDFAATGNGTTPDTAAVQNAADAVKAAGGGILYFPPGVYLIGTILIPSNTWVLGAGYGSYSGSAAPSVLKKHSPDPPAHAYILRLLGVSNVRISNLAFDFNPDQNYLTAVDIGLSTLSTTVTDNPLSAAALVVNVASTAGFPDSGELFIDAERITYTTRTATSFSGLERGANGTSATTHALGATVRVLSTNIMIDSNSFYHSRITTVTDDPLMPSATTVNVVSTAQFTATTPPAALQHIQIDTEDMTYGGQTATSFTGLGRPPSPPFHARGSVVNAAIRNYTLHAVLCQFATRVWILNNRTHNCQLKVGNDPTGPNIVFAGNMCTDSRNSAITVLANYNNTVTDVSILDNHIDAANDCAIYFGSDNNLVASGIINRVTVRGNVIRRIGTINGGILGRMGIASADWAVVDNIVVHEGPIPSGTYGIHISGPVTGGALTRLIIANNLVKTCDQPGIYVAGAVTKFTIRGNVLEQTRGIRLQPGVARNQKDGLLSENVVSGGGRGIEIDAHEVGGPFGPIKVFDNVLKNASEAGIQVKGGANVACDVEIYGNRCYDDQPTKTQDYGIDLDLDPNDLYNVRIRDNDLRGNLVAGVHFTGSTPSLQWLFQNRGWITESSGTAAIPGAVKVVTVVHGLSRQTIPAPVPLGLTAANFLLSIQNNPTNDPGFVWVSDITDTDFKINCRNTPGSNLLVTWRVRLRLPPI